MEIGGLSVPEAVKAVGERSGMPWPEPVDDVNYQKNKKKKEAKKKIADQVIDLNRIELEFWEAELQKKNAKAKVAREYLETRGISEETQRAFHIGFAPDSWDSLLNLLKRRRKPQISNRNKFTVFLPETPSIYASATDVAIFARPWPRSGGYARG